MQIQDASGLNTLAVFSRSTLMGLLDDIFDIIAPQKQYGTPSTTKAGMNVRSRAEKRIADYFEDQGIRYEYEPEIEAGIWIFSETVSRPDFYLLDYDVYVEYWGMLDVEDEYKRQEYERAMRYKMARYHQLGIRFISIYPRNLNNLHWVFRKKFKDVTGFELPRFKDASKPHAPA